MLCQFLALLSVHWYADFVLQTHWQAANKSKRMDALLQHVAVYTLALTIAACFIFPDGPGHGRIYFIAVNGFLHLATDFVTSRISSRLFMAQFESFEIVLTPPLNEPTYPARYEMRLFMKKNFNPHNFFVVIGLDQLIHQVTLAGTMMFFFGVR